VAEELPAVDEPSVMPGWGMWADQQREPRWMRDARAKAAAERKAAASARADAGKAHVVISEKWDKKASKYFTPTVPYPFATKELYEKAIRAPLGRDTNPDRAFRDLTRPAVLKSTGVVIEPIRFSAAAAAEARETRGGSVRVATVAGGKPRRAAR